MKARYLNPFTAPKGHQNFGFKKLFGEEASKPLLSSWPPGALGVWAMDFLNALLPLDYPITNLNFRNAKPQQGSGA